MSTSALGDAGFWILTALASGRLHGYAVLSAVRAASGGDADPKVTTLYATLDRLEQRGLIASDGEEIVDGRARRYFVLTPSGTARLRVEVEALEARATAARAALAGATTLPRPAGRRSGWAGRPA